MPVVINLNFEVFSPNAYPLHHFSDDFTPITVLQPLNEEIAYVVPMEEVNEGQTLDEDVAQSYELDVEITRATCDPIPNLVGKGRKRTKSSYRLQSSPPLPKKIKNKASISHAVESQVSLNHHFQSHEAS